MAEARVSDIQRGLGEAYLHYGTSLLASTADYERQPTACGLERVVKSFVTFPFKFMGHVAVACGEAHLKNADLAVMLKTE